MHRAGSLSPGQCIADAEVAVLHGVVAGLRRETQTIMESGTHRIAHIDFVKLFERACVSPITDSTDGRESEECMGEFRTPTFGDAKNL